MFVGNISGNCHCIEVKKFTDHPIRVGTDPEYYCQIMTDFANVLPGSDGNYDCYDQCWKYHTDAERPPDHTPADIFK